MSERVEIVVGKEGQKARLDEYLFSYFGGLSKMYLRDIVKSEKCEVNGRTENVGHRLRENDLIEIELDLTRETSMRPQEMELEIVFEDTDLVVVNKPAGMLVHPTNRDKSGTLLNGLSYYLNAAAPDVAVRPGLIHRLDKQTSGLIVIAKNQHSHKKMTRYFQQRYVQKWYLALVDGVVAEDEGTISASIGRYGDLKHWDVMEGAKPSETHFRVLRRDADKTLLELRPVTGRTNQLRIHCSHIGHPIVGDEGGRGGSEHDRLCLHAWKLSFRHPSTHDQLELTCEPADAFHHDAMLIRQSSATRS